MPLNLMDVERNLIISTLRKLADQIENDRVMVDGYEIGMNVALDEGDEDKPLIGQSIVKVQYHLPSEGGKPREAKQLGLLPD